MRNWIGETEDESVSIYAYLNCHDCRQSLWLGKALHDNYRSYCFHMGGADEPPPWKREVLNRILWKFLADHSGHRIDVRLEHEMTVEMFGYQEIGGDRNEDVSYEQYLTGGRGIAVTTMSIPSAQAVLAGPRPLRWTCAEFHRFGDMGVFEGRGAMLIDGVILEQGPMNPPHAITLELVGEALRTAFGVGWWLRHQSPLILGQDTDPEPDLAVVPGRPRDYAGHPTTAELLIEVADSSLSFDTNEKRLLYARASIREYWVVDINGRRLLVYRAPQMGDYATQQALGPADAIAPLAAPAAVVRVADLLV
jgi:Uma2 family endonuclease